jgi:hypothetical protein
MTDNRHYNCFVTRPAVGSRYEFLLTGFAIQDAEPQVPLWMPPFEIGAELQSEARAYFSRWNVPLKAIEASWRSEAIETLRHTGIPSCNLVEPLGERIEGLVTELVIGRRSVLRLRQEAQLKPAAEQPLPFDGERFDRDHCARVITAAYFNQSVRSNEATAKALNVGLSIGVQGLTRHHVLRAVKTCRARWKRSAYKKYILLLLSIDCDLVAALDIVRSQARNHAKFKKYKGADLAWAVHEEFDLNERIYRAHRILTADRVQVARSQCA